MRLAWIHQDLVTQFSGQYFHRESHWRFATVTATAL